MQNSPLFSEKYLIKMCIFLYFFNRTIQTPLMGNSRDNIYNHNADNQIVDHEDIEIREGDETGVTEGNEKMEEVDIGEAENENLVDADCIGDDAGDGGDCGGGDD